jgi:purine-binding chemotaxis protein CheW
MDLAKKFGMKSQGRTEKSRIIVVEIKENILGLIVDDVSEVLRISESQIDPTPPVISSQVHSEYIRGVGKLKNKLIILLLAEKILSHEEVKRVGEVTKGS